MTIEVQIKNNDKSRSVEVIEVGIDKAIVAERERCAKIAENWHPMLYAPELGGSHPRDSAVSDAKQAIAKAIRTQE